MEIYSGSASPVCQTQPMDTTQYLEATIAYSDDQAKISTCNQDANLDDSSLHIPRVSFNIPMKNTHGISIPVIKVT